VAQYRFSKSASWALREQWTPGQPLAAFLLHPQALAVDRMVLMASGAFRQPGGRRLGLVGYLYQARPDGGRRLLHTTQPAVGAPLVPAGISEAEVPRGTFQPLEEGLPVTVLVYVVGNPAPSSIPPSARAHVQVDFLVRADDR
jgi:hypothetical protein